MPVPKLYYSVIFIFFLPIAAALFQLNSPPSRGYNATTISSFPCGGFNTTSANRTAFPLSGGPIQLSMDSNRAEVQALLGLGNDVGLRFDTTLVDIVEEVGMGLFCLDDMILPDGLDLQEGQNGTIQIVTSGDDDDHGVGLYSCADIIFSSTAPMGVCTNGSGVTSTGYSGPHRNANETDEASGMASGTGSVSKPSPTTGSAGRVEMDFWTVILGGIVTAVI